MQTLYAASPDDFMAARSALVAAAKAAGQAGTATEIGKLRKPSLAAWAVNLTARAAPDVVTALTELGAQMRSAQSRIDTGALSAMRGERDAAVDAFVRAATESVSAAGRKLSAAAQQDVRATAIAALADERASAAVTSGQLTRALSYSGFGEVDLDEAVARTTGGAILTILPGGRGQGSRGRRTRRPTGQGRPDGSGADDHASGDDGDDEGEPPTAEELEQDLDGAEQGLATRRPPSTRRGSGPRTPGSGWRSSSASWPRPERPTNARWRRSPTRSGRASGPRPRGIPLQEALDDARGRD